LDGEVKNRSEVMRRLYFLTAGLAKRLFRASGLRVPGAARRLNKYLGRKIDQPRQRSPEPRPLEYRDELEALKRRVERLETQSYLDSIGRRRD
jgi:hypothetical protein